MTYHVIAFGSRRWLSGSAGSYRRAAEEFPSRPVRLVMGFGAGGLGDIAGRAIGQNDGGVARQAGGDREHAGRRRHDGGRRLYGRRPTATPCCG